MLQKTQRTREFSFNLTIDSAKANCLANYIGDKLSHKVATVQIKHFVHRSASPSGVGGDMTKQWSDSGPMKIEYSSTPFTFKMVQ